MDSESTLSEAPDIAVPAEKAQELSDAIAEIGAPSSITDEVLELTKHHGPEILTAVVGFISINLINAGSARYGDLQHATSEEEIGEITKDASGKILGGNVALTAMAFAAGNPLFAIPEIGLILSSLRPYLDSRNKTIAKISARFRTDIALTTSAIAIGSYTVANHASNVSEALPPIGLTMLATAFSMGGTKAREWMYRILTIGGGSTLTVGSTFAAVEAAQQNNPVGVVMSSVFLVLNGLFTRNELKATMRLFRMKKDTVEQIEEVLDEKEKK